MLPIDLSTIAADFESWVVGAASFGLVVGVIWLGVALVWKVFTSLGGGTYSNYDPLQDSWANTSVGGVTPDGGTIISHDAESDSVDFDPHVDFADSGDDLIQYDPSEWTADDQLEWDEYQEEKKDYE